MASSFRPAGVRPTRRSRKRFWPVFAVFAAGWLTSAFLLAYSFFIAPGRVHLGPSFRPGTPSVVSLDAGERAAIFARNTSEYGYVPVVSCAVHDAKGSAGAIRPSSNEAPAEDGIGWSPMGAFRAPSAGEYTVTCENESRHAVFLATGNDPWLNELVGRTLSDDLVVMSERLMIPPLSGIVLAVLLGVVIERRGRVREPRGDRRRRDPSRTG